LNFRKYRELIPFVHHKFTNKQVPNWRAWGKAPCFHIDVFFSVTQYISEEAVLLMCIEKNVVGFHLMNIGALAMQGKIPLFVSCAPKGCIELLFWSCVVIKGKCVNFIGHNNIVGTPIALFLHVFKCCDNVGRAFFETFVSYDCRICQQRKDTSWLLMYATKRLITSIIGLCIVA